LRGNDAGGASIRRRFKSAKAVELFPGGFVVARLSFGRVRLFPLDDGLAFAGGRLDLDLGIEHIAAAGRQLDDLALAIAQRRSQFTDALKQAVVADVDVGSDRVHQLLLAENPPGVGSKQNQEVESLGPQLDRAEVGVPKLGTLLIEFNTSKPGALNLHG
jgi:hypothetical protein